MSILFSVSHIQIPLSGWYVLYIVLVNIKFQDYDNSWWDLSSLKMAPKCRTRHYLTLINYKSLWCQNLPSLMMTGGGAEPICRSGQWNSRNHSRNKCATRAFGYTCRIWGRKGGMSNCLQEKHKIIRISKTTENQEILNWNVRFLDLKNTFFAFGKHWFLN